MRFGIVRADMGRGLHLDDVLSRNQYAYASGVPGQTRVVRRPSNADLEAVLAANPIPAYVDGSDTAATVDTSVNDTLRIRTSPADAYIAFVVTSGAGTAKTVIRDDLNAGFVAANLPLVASIAGTNQLAITTTASNRGPDAYLQIDSVANGSTLSTAVGYTVGGELEQGVSTASAVVSLLANLYPTSTTIDVSAAAMEDVFPGLEFDPGAAATVAAVAEAVAPYFVETGLMQLSFAQGKLSEMVKTTFQPGGARAGLPAGIAVAVLEDDGVTVYT